MNISWTHLSGRHRPNIVHFLYGRMAVQCKQCGLRFSDTAQGKGAMQEHLDMHFRQNRKASQSVGRGHSRSWFLGAEVSSAAVSYELSLTGLYVGLDP